MKIPKATVTAVLYGSKILANGEHPVMIRVCYNSKRRYKSTGLSCPVKYWSAAKQEVRKRHPLAPNINAIIGSELTALKNKVLDFERQGFPTPCSAYSKFRCGNLRREKTCMTSSKSESLISGTPCRNTTRRPDTRRCSILSNGFRRTGPSSCSTWTAHGSASSRSTCARYADTSIKRFFSVLKALMNYACQNGLLDVNPFGRFRLSRRLDVRTAKRALETDELDSLIRYDLDTYYYKPRNNVSRCRL